jgi:hypothetical protein
MPEHKPALGAPSYHWLRVRALAACGEYAQAEDECAQMLAASDDPAGGPGPLREQIALRVGQGVLDEAPGWGIPPFSFQKVIGRQDFRQRAYDLARSLRQEADVRTLRGVLALEEGQLSSAEADFRRALDLWQNDAAAAAGSGLDFSGRLMARDCLEWLRRDQPDGG